MAFYLERGQVLLYGGLGSDNFVLGDTWIWDGTNWKNWIQNSPVRNPGPRAHHAMAYDGAHAQIILFGGHSSYSGGNTGHAKFINETWAWNGTNWMEPAPSSSPPPAAGHRMVYDQVRRQVMLFNDFIGTWISD